MSRPAVSPAAAVGYAGSGRSVSCAALRHISRGNQVQPYLNLTAEFFDRAAVPPEIAELLEEWPEIDSGTARLVRTAVMSREPRRLRQAWEMLNARAELAHAMRLNGSSR